MKDVLFDNASLLERTKQAGMWGASMTDSLAWGQLWNAVEAETKAKHKALEVGSEAYYETVAKRFTEIVDHTQVVDGIMQRSQIMRSPDALTKMATSFMGEPTKQYNMAVAAAYDAINSKGETRKKAVARLGRTATALAVAGIINACAQSIIDARNERPFISKQDLLNRTQISTTHFQTFDSMGMLDDMANEEQLTLSLF
jgi:hypothetical protein